MKIRQVIAGVLLAALMGCAGNPGENQPTTAITQPPADTTLGLAFPADGPTRSVAATETITRMGIDYFHLYGEVTFGASTLTLQPDAGALSYAIYRFHAGAFPVAAINFTITANDPDKTWFGLSDYTAQHWQFTQAEPGMSSLGLGSDSVSPNGYLFFAVVAHDQTDTVIQSASIDLDVPGWNEYILDDQNHAGQAVSAERYGNLIGIAYSANGSEKLLYARSLALLPTSVTDWAFSEITTNTTCDALELQRINNLPMVAYVHGQTATTRFARAASTAPTGSGDWYFVYPAANAIPGYIALTGINDAPAVAYVDPGISMHSIDYTYSTIGDPTILADWLVTEAVSNPMMPPFADFSEVSLLSYSGLPYLTYFNEQLDRLVFAGADTATPLDTTSWSSGPVTEAGAGRYCRGVEFGGKPALVFIDHDNGFLSYARGSTWNPTGPGDWYQQHDIDQSGTADGPVDIVRLNLGLGVAYYDSADQAIKYAWVNSGTPGSGKSWRIVTVAEGIGSNPALSLVVLQNGLPAIAYYHPAADRLMFAAMQE